MIPSPIPTPLPDDDDDDDGVDAASALAGVNFWIVIIVVLLLLNIFLCILLWCRVCIAKSDDELTEHMELDEKISFASCSMDGPMKLEAVYAGKAMP